MNEGNGHWRNIVLSLFSYIADDMTPHLNIFTCCRGRGGYTSVGGFAG